MSGEKAQFQIQFNWLFVMIVGGVILMFFSSMVMEQKDISGQRVAVNVLNDLETVATGAGVSQDTAQVLDKPSITLHFDCADCDCRYSMEGNSRGFNDQVMFTPRRVERDTLIAWTKDWAVPYRVTNFLFISSPQIMYYIIDDTSQSVGKHINSSLPSKVHRRYVDSPPPEDMNYPQVKLFYIGSCPGETSAPIDGWGLDPKDVSATCADGLTENLQRGDLTFYRVDNNGDFKEEGSVEFAGKESLYAALFAFTYENYECNMKAAFDRMSIISRIYRKRTEKLSTTTMCQLLYSDAEVILQNIETNTSTLANNLEASLSSFYDVQDELADINNRLKLKSCPGIY